MLARLVGVNRITIWRWVEGVTKPTKKHPALVEKALGPLAFLVLPEDNRN